MSTPSQAAERARQAVRDGAHAAAPALETLARAGYFSKGLVYVTVGVLAVMQASHVQGGATTSQQGALRSVADLPGGATLIVLLGLGLAGYAVWQVLRAVLDPERQGHGPKGLLKRGGYLMSAVAYLGLAGLAVLHGGRTSGGAASGTEDWTARLLHLPGGQVLVALVGLAFFGVAGNQLYVAVRASFMKRIALTDLGARHRTAVQRTGQLGIGARAVVAALIGWFFLQAALHADPERAGGLQDALLALAGLPYGRFLFGLCAVGLVLYGLYGFVQGAYRRIRLRDAA